MNAASASPFPGSPAPSSSQVGTTREHLQQSFEATKELDGVCTAFELALSHGERPDIEVLVQTASEPLRARLFRELLAIEMEFHQSRGETPSLDEYRQRYPSRIPLVKSFYLEYFTPAMIGDFPIQRLIGRGGFGHVYQAWDPKLSRAVAVKVFRRDPERCGVQGSLLLEARSAAQLRHPGIVAVHAILPDVDGDEFLVLEYVDGSSLEDVLRSSRLTSREAASLILAVVQALQHAHQHGLVHRDLKPANVLLEQGCRPRVTDFGLALQLSDARRSRGVAGTLSYMAPEQANGETHRLDARTDIWAVGVVLYRMLTGRLPFSSPDNRSLLHAIQYEEPVVPGAEDRSIAPELARIAMHCLSKRMSERYQTASELAEDLTAFLAREAPSQPGEIGDKLDRLQVAVVPKGLRCFDTSDQDYFLQLVPGPRDRFGIPQGVRFWEERLRKTDAYRAFRVGLLYGPSGCGKSSLVRAGVLPRLPGNVRRILIECSQDQSEVRILTELRRHFPELNASLSLSESLGELREGTLLASGEKVVLVIDQFEQWLHGWQQDTMAPLVESLRQCDGGRIQALVLVRDDFWMQATRFFKQLDVPLLEGENAAAVDLFDGSHAKRVLAAIGEAYGRLSSDRSLRTADQERFLDLAVGELADDGWVVPIRLCIFAEMVKTWTWVPATLKELGGSQGLGVTFLEEAFNGRTAAPMHRLHQKAARAVLEQLLPPAGSDIRGHLKPEAELRIASGYEQSPSEFATLLRCLDQELRLITPSEPPEENESPSSPSDRRSYQLAHDFLVDAIRRWLNQDRSRTIRGRAELRLIERSQAYAQRRDERQLPAWWEWLWIAALTQSRRRTQRERELMKAANRKYALRIGGIVAAVILLVLAIYDRYGSLRAESVVQNLSTSDPRALPAAVAQLPPFTRWVKPQLDERLHTAEATPEERTRLMLGQLALNALDPLELTSQFLDASPPLALSMVEILRETGGLVALAADLEPLAKDSAKPDFQRLRAIIALANLEDTTATARWQELAPVAARLAVRDISENPSHFEPWSLGLRRIGHHLLNPLSEMFEETGFSRQERLLVTQLIIDCTKADADRLLELALRAESWQTPALIKALTENPKVIKPTLLNEATSVLKPAASPAESATRAARSANAIVLLQSLGDERHLWPALSHSRTPDQRSYLLRHYHELPAPWDWLDRLPSLDAGGRQAVILALGSRAKRTEEAKQPPQLREVLLERFCTDPDSGVHSAAEWALNQAGLHGPMSEARLKLANLGLQKGFGWYVTESGVTMVVVRPQGKVQLGSPESEDGHESDEAQWEIDHNWSFAISSQEITQQQFKAIMGEYRDYLNEFAPTMDAPANSMQWIGAAHFCRLLSEVDGIAEGEMAIPPVEKLTSGPYPDILGRSGYRLPTEIEWEIACRAETVTTRYFGNDPNLLPLFACYVENFGGRAAPVGSYFPNAWGCFDTLGNVAEWCYNIYQTDLAERWERHVRPPGYRAMGSFGVRGNEYLSSPRMLRSANRRDGRAGEYIFSRGFRIAHTVKLN